MLDSNTLYLLSAMGVFILFAVLLVHHHNANEAIQRKRLEVEGATRILEQKMEVLELEINDLKEQIDDVDIEIETIEQT